MATIKILVTKKITAVLLSLLLPGLLLFGLAKTVRAQTELILNGGFDPGLALAFWDLTGSPYWELVSGDGMARVPSNSSVSQQFTPEVTGTHTIEFWCTNVFAQGVALRMTIDAGADEIYSEAIWCLDIVHPRDVMLVGGTTYTLTFAYEQGAPVGARLDDISVMLTEEAPDFDSGYVVNGAFYGPAPWGFSENSQYEMYGDIGYNGRPGYAHVVPLGGHISQTLITVPTDGIYELTFNCKNNSSVIESEIQFLLTTDDFRTSDLFTAADCSPSVWAVTTEYYLLFAGYDYTLWFENENLSAHAYLDNISLLESGIDFHHVNTGAILNGEWYGYDEWGFSDGGGKFDNHTGVTTDTVGSLVLYETVQEDLVAQEFIIDDPAPTVERVLSFDCSSLYGDSLLDVRLELGIATVFYEQLNCATDEAWTHYAYTLTLLTDEEYRLELELFENEIGFSEYIWVDNVALPLSELEPTPTPTPSPSPTATHTPPPTNTPTPTATGTPGPTDTPGPSPTPTATPSATPPGGGGDDPTCVFEPNNPACIPAPTGPAGGTCYLCSTPRRLSSSLVSYWIAWLGCLIRNLFSCSLRVWLYNITNGVNALAHFSTNWVIWANGNMQDGLNWTGAGVNNGLLFAYDMYQNLANFLASVPQSVNVVINNIVNQVTQGSDWLDIVWSIIQILFSLFVLFVVRMYMGILGMVLLLISGVRGVQTAFNAPPFELSEVFTGSIVPATPAGEPSEEAAYQMLLWGIKVGDVAVADFGLWPFVYLVAGILGVITIFWVLRQWQDILPM